MGVVTINMLLEYLYKKFIVTFILCLIGVFVNKSIKASKLENINFKKALASTIVASVLVCFIIDIVDLSFSVYIVVSILVGIWSTTILKLIMDIKFIRSLTINILKMFKIPITNLLSDTLKDMNEDCTEKDEDDKESSTK